MKMPISEIADRYSITLLKNERIEGIDLSLELKMYKEELDKSLIYKFILIDYTK